MAAPGNNFLMIEEVNSDNGEPQMLRNFPLSKTVKDLKMEIARMMGEPNEWRSVIVFFLGQEMENENKSLSHYHIQNTDTIFFVRSVDPPPPYVSNNAGFPNDKKGAATQDPSGIILGTLFFKDGNGRSLTLENVPISMTVAKVRERLSNEKYVEYDSTRRFTFGGKPLDDAKTLMDYNVQNESTVEIVWRVPGGL
ncbi:hypothetical protein V8F20_001899 [Naviculisporaceae sp. PSN 640]